MNDTYLKSKKILIVDDEECLWIVYPYCYSGYVVSNALHTVTATDTGSTLSLFPFIPCAVIISVFAICVSIKYFGRKEMS